MISLSRVRINSLLVFSIAIVSIILLLSISIRSKREAEKGSASSQSASARVDSAITDNGVKSGAGKSAAVEKSDLDSKKEKRSLSRNRNEDEAEESEKEEEAGLRRDDWLIFQRAYPAESIPFDAGIRMVEQLELEERRMKEEAASGNINLTTAAEALPVWAALGPQPIISGQTFGNPRNNVSGRVSAIAVDPRYDGATNQTVYVGGAQGGVWKSTDNGANWTPLTDGQSSQATGAIAIDPKFPQTLYVGTGEGSRCALCYYGAGMLKSTDGGTTWQVITGPLSTGTPSIPVFQNAAFTRIAIDPVNTSTIFACTTFGTTATANSNASQVNIAQVGVWKSTNGGATWRNMDPGGTNGTFSAHDLVIDPQNTSRVFAGMRTIGVYRSEQGGEPGTWTRLAGGLPDPTNNTSNSPFRRVALTTGPPIPPSTNTTLYAAFATPSDNLLGIWRSTDNGNTWTQTSTPQSGSQANYNLDIATDPLDGNIVYYATGANSIFTDGTLWRSKDGGQTWASITRGDGVSGGLHADTHQIVIPRLKPDVLFTGNDGGIWRTDTAKDAIVSWRQLNNTLSLSQFMSVALHPTDPNIIIGGTQDNGTNRFRGNVAWDHIADGDGGYVLIDQSNPQVMYHTYFNENDAFDGQAQIGPRVSLSGGSSWIRRGCFGCTTIKGNFNPKDRVAFYAPMALNSGFKGANANVVYFGTHRLYRTADQGITWTGLGQSADGFGADLTDGAGMISAIAGHPALDNSTNPPGEIVWAGTSDGNIQVTTNAGAAENATFTNVTKSPLPDRYLTDIALDDSNSQRAVITYSGFNSATASTPGHVFQTTNRGASWTNISGNLPDVPVTSVAVNPNNSNTIYIGTDLGVFQTTDGGITWVRLGNGMPRIATFMVRYHKASSSLIAATHGRGIYRLTTANDATTVSSANYSGLSIATESIVAVFGSNMATDSTSASGLPLPTSLSGTRVAVRDSAGIERLSSLFYVSPQQVNFQIPAGSAAGPATVTITSSDGTVAIGAIQIEVVAPSLYSANASGSGIAAGSALRVSAANVQTSLPINTFDSASKLFVSVPIDLGSATDQTFLLLYGTGFRYRSQLSNVTATIGGVTLPVQYAGPQGTYVGLDQLNILLPKSLTGRGEVDVIITVDNKQANKLKVRIQ